MNRNYWFCLFMLISSAYITGCADNDKKPVTTNPILQKPASVMQPFRYHKLIEVSPGEDYDVLSWGGGSSKTGAFEILHSDSAAAKYTTTTGDLEGAIVDVYNSDMDLDGNPEIIIQAKSKDTINYTNIYAFEFGNNKVQKLDFPKLNRSQRKGYHGNDNFYIKDGILMREFPVYSGNGKEAAPTNEKRRFQYGLRNNSFTVKQLSKDSIEVKALKTQRNEPIKNAVNNKPITKKHKKESTPTKKHKRKHRRRHSNE